MVQRVGFHDGGEEVIGGRQHKWLPGCGCILTAVNYSLSFFVIFWCVANPKTMCDKPVPPEGERSAQVLHRGVCGAHQVWPRYRARGASPGKTRCAEQGFPFQSKWEVPSPPEHASWWQHQGTITRWFVFLWRSGASLVLRMLGKHSTILRLHFLPTASDGWGSGFVPSRLCKLVWSFLWPVHICCLFSWKLSFFVVLFFSGTFLLAL